MKTLPETLSPLQEKILERLKSLQNGGKYAFASYGKLSNYTGASRSGVQKAVINLERKEKIKMIKAAGSRRAGGKYQESKFAILQQ